MIAAGASVFHTLIVHHENGVPLQCEDRYVNPACSPGYLSADFTATTPTQVLFETTALWRAQYSIEAALPTAEEAALLGIAPQDPCLVVVRRKARFVFSEGRRRMLRISLLTECVGARDGRRAGAVDQRERERACVMRLASATTTRWSSS